MMNQLLQSKMMDKIMELQDWIYTMTDMYGYEHFNISATGTKSNQDVTVFGLTVEYANEGDNKMILLNDFEDKLIVSLHPLAMLTEDQITKIKINRHNIIITVGSAAYTITPVRG